MLKEQFKQARLNAVKLTDEKLQEHGLVSDGIVRGRPDTNRGAGASSKKDENKELI